MPGFTFTGWSGDCASDGTVTMTKIRRVRRTSLRRWQLVMQFSVIGTPVINIVTCPADLTLRSFVLVRLIDLGFFFTSR